MEPNLEDAIEIEVSATTVRAWLDDPQAVGTKEEPEARGNVEIFNDDLEGALDKAQGDITTGQTDEVFIIIKVVV